MSDFDQNTGANAGAATPTPTPTPAPVATIKDEVRLYRLALTAPLVKGGQPVMGAEQRLYFSCWKGNPRLTLEPRDPDAPPPAKENNWNRFSAGTSMETLKNIRTLIEELVRGGKADHRRILHSNTYNGGQKFEQPTHINTTIVGRDEDGRMWITLQEGAHPVTKFYFGKSPWTSYQGADKQELPAAQVSQMSALSYMDGVINQLSDIAAIQLLHVGEVEDGPNGGGNRGGQGGQRQGGGGNWQNRNGGGFNRGGGGGGFNRGGGGGNWQNRGGGGGGNWNRNGGGGGGGNWQNRNNNGGGGNWQNRNQNGGGGGAPAQSADISDADITF